MLDYRELNGFVDAFTANVEMCAQKIGLNMAALFMKSVIDTIVSRDHAIKNATSVYVHDIYLMKI